MLDVCGMNESDQMLKICERMLSEPECWKFWTKICNGGVRPKPECWKFWTKFVTEVCVRKVGKVGRRACTVSLLPPLSGGGRVRRGRSKGGDVLRTTDYNHNDKWLKLGWPMLFFCN